MSVSSDCWLIVTPLFLLSQSERLQNWCQSGTAGNWCDQHHGFLCVGLPCHWQLWEVCMCMWDRQRDSSLESSDVWYLHCHVFSSHPGQLWTLRLVCALQLEGLSPVSPDIFKSHCVSSALLWWSVLSSIIHSSLSSLLPFPSLSPLVRCLRAVMEVRGKSVKGNIQNWF